MNTHALKVGACIVLLYIACLLWRFTMIDPAVMNFHLLSLKSVFPGFSGYTAASILWGAILSFAYGYIGSVIFYSLHSECCVSKHNGKKEEKMSLSTTNLMWVVGALAVGVAVGLLLAQTATPFSRDYVTGSAGMMRNGGSSMMQFSDMMQNTGRMMQERGGRYNDQEMMERGREMMERGEQFRKNGSDMMERGNGMMNMMR